MNRFVTGHWIFIQREGFGHQISKPSVDNYFLHPRDFLRESNMKKTLLAATVTAVMASFATHAIARDYIRIVGSSTVFPFAAAVAESIGRSASFKTPEIESTGSGGGIEHFCAGVGVDHPDITNASRRIESSEFDNCRANGVEDIVEVKIGYDGIAIADFRVTNRWWLDGPAALHVLAQWNEML
jgi:hypothetical protein